MNKKLTDSEIIKALEDVLHRINGATRICVPQKSIEEFYNVLQNSLDLINRLETENEENKTIIKVADKTIATLNAENESLKAEVERLTEENKKVSAYIGNGWGYVSFLEFVKNQRTEAYKEVFEKLNKKAVVRKIKIFGGLNSLKVVLLHDINALKNELLGDK